MNNIVGIGIDIEPVASFRKKNIDKDKAFYSKIFSDKEISYCMKFRDPAPHFTARFCAKEAMVKASRSCSPLFLTDCEVFNLEGGAPILQPRSERTRVHDFFQDYHVWLSLSHTKELAIAFVVVTKPSRKKYYD